MKQAKANDNVHNSCNGPLQVDFKPSQGNKRQDESVGRKLDVIVRVTQVLNQSRSGLEDKRGDGIFKLWCATIFSV